MCGEETRSKGKRERPEGVIPRRGKRGNNTEGKPKGTPKGSGNRENEGKGKKERDLVFVNREA